MTAPGAGVNVDDISLEDGCLALDSHVEAPGVADTIQVTVPFDTINRSHNVTLDVGDTGTVHKVKLNQVQVHFPLHQVDAKQMYWISLKDKEKFRVVMADTETLLPKVGDRVRILNASSSWSDSRYIGAFGTLDKDSSPSTTPFRVRFADGQAFWFKQDDVALQMLGDSARQAVLLPADPEALIEVDTPSQLNVLRPPEESSHVVRTSSWSCRASWREV